MPLPSFFTSCFNTVKTDVEDLLAELNTAAGYVSNIVAQAQQFLQVLITVDPALALNPAVIDAMDALALVQGGITIVDALATKMGPYVPLGFDPTSIPNLSQASATISANAMIPLLSSSSKILSKIVRAGQIDADSMVNWNNAHKKLLAVYKQLDPSTDYKTNLTSMRTQKLALHAIPAEQSRTQLAAERDSAIQRAEANARAYQQAAARYQVLAGDHTALTDAHSSLVTAHAQLVQDFSQRPRVTVVRSGPTPLVRNAFLANISNRAANSLPDEDAIDRNYRRRY